MQDSQDKERRVLRIIIDGLNDLESEARARILRAAQTFFGLDSPSPHTTVATSTSTSPNARDPGAPAFSARTELTPKEFLFQKQPSTDVERVACLAYYLTHYRGTPHFKTVDISKINTEAAQSKFSNTAYAVTNASNSGLLVPAGKGNKQLSARGELYVEALPNREAIKELPKHLSGRRSKRKPSPKKP